MYTEGKPLYKLQEQLLDVSGPLTCLWADLMRKEASLSAEDILLTVQRALVLRQCLTCNLVGVQANCTGKAEPEVESPCN